MTFPHSATIKRTSKVGVKYTYASVGTTPCFLQPLDAQKAQLWSIAMTKASQCYLPLTADVLEGDQLVISGSTYGVKGIKKHNYGSLAHQSSILEQV